MKIRFTAPTEPFPFFHNVKVRTANGWQKVLGQGPLGWQAAVFPTQAEMIAGVRRVAR